jgi:hypothetical protein
MCEHKPGSLKFYAETAHIVCLDCGKVWTDRSEAPEPKAPDFQPWTPAPAWPPYYPYTGDPVPFWGPIITCFDSTKPQ